MGTTFTPSQFNRAGSAQWLEMYKLVMTELRCATPAFLTDDLGTDQTVTVQIAIQERVRTLTGPEWWDVPPIIKVPIVIPRGGGFSMTLPLKKGDEGLLVFCDTCFDNWWISGQNNAPVAKNTGVSSGSQQQFEVRRHHVHDCGFIPGMYSKPNLLSNYSTTSMQLRSDDGTTIIDVADGSVTVIAPQVNVKNTGGTTQTLMTNTFLQYWITNILPFLQSKGYVGPTTPANSATTILKGQ